MEILIGNKLKKHKTQMRWSEAVLTHTRMKQRLFDQLPKGHDSKADLEPIGSSFSKDKLFKDPLDAIRGLKNKAEAKVQLKQAINNIVKQ